MRSYEQKDGDLWDLSGFIVFWIGDFANHGDLSGFIQEDKCFNHETWRFPADTQNNWFKHQKRDLWVSRLWGFHQQWGQVAIRMVKFESVWCFFLVAVNNRDYINLYNKLGAEHKTCSKSPRISGSVPTVLKGYKYIYKYINSQNWRVPQVFNTSEST
jgi:hypothetical protein